MLLPSTGVSTNCQKLSIDILGNSVLLLPGWPRPADCGTTAQVPLVCQVRGVSVCSAQQGGAAHSAAVIVVWQDVQWHRAYRTHVRGTLPG